MAFVAGLAVSFIPGVPQFHLDPQIVLGLMLPPLLYNATVNTSVQLVRFTLVSGVLLGAVLVPATIGAVALTAHALVPGLGWVSAVLLGVVASVSETRLLREIGKARHLPRVIADVLRGQELVAPAMIVSTLLLAIDAASSGPPSAADLAIRSIRSTTTSGVGT